MMDVGPDFTRMGIAVLKRDGHLGFIWVEH
jgi:hypothetical protein